jgi:hypothetical protein
LLAAASALVAGLPTRSSWIRRGGVCTVATALGGRAALGFAGKTDVVSPGSTSAHFRRIDRRYYSPPLFDADAGRTELAASPSRLNRAGL